MTCLSRTLVRRVFVTLLLTTAVVSDARGGENNQGSATMGLAIGSRARIVLAGRSASPVVGTVKAMDDASITIETSEGATIRTPRNEIQSLQVSVQRRNTTKGAVIGAASFAAAGVGFASVICSEFWKTTIDPTTSTLSCTGSDKFQFAALSAAAGAFGGGLAGYLIRSDRWIDLPLTTTSLPPDSLPVPGASPAEPGPPPPSVTSNLRPPALSGASPQLFAGARIRIFHEGRKTEGLLVDLSETSVTLAASGGTVTIPRVAVAGIEAWGGERKQALKGALIGAVAGAALDFTSEPNCGGDRQGFEDCSRLVSASETAAGGAIIGAAFGLLIKKTTWIPVSLNQAPAPESARPPGDLTWQVSPTFNRKGHAAGLLVRLTW